MIWKFDLSDELKKKLKKLMKKDKVLYEATYDKINEIITGNPERYKPLRKDLKNKKRVHVIRPFVLVFEPFKKEGKVKFYDLDHHDVIYSKIF